MGLHPGEQISQLRKSIAAGELPRAATRSQASQPTHNLPVQPTPFVGRETELAEIRRLMSDPDCRLKPPGTRPITAAAVSGSTQLKHPHFFPAGPLRRHPVEPKIPRYGFRLSRADRRGRSPAG